MNPDNASKVATTAHAHADSHSSSSIPRIAPSRTALLVMHYQTDILGLFPSVAPELLSNTRRLCDAARAAGVGVNEQIKH